jgi:hypothetical protein
MIVGARRGACVCCRHCLVTLGPQMALSLQQLASRLQPVLKRRIGAMNLPDALPISPGESLVSVAHKTHEDLGDAAIAGEVEFRDDFARAHATNVAAETGIGIAVDVRDARFDSGMI